MPQGHGVGIVGHDHACGVFGHIGVDKAEQQHRQHRPHRAQRHQAEGVGLRVLVRTDGGHAHAQGHDKGHRHGPGGHPAGVKGHRQIVRVGQRGQGKHRKVQRNQQPFQRNGKQNAHHAQQQEQPHAHRHGEGQHGGVDGGYVGGQHLQIRLGHGDGDAQQQAD